MTDHAYTFEEVLDRLLLDEPEPSYAALTRWADRYPHFSEALARFFIVWAKQADGEEEKVPSEDSLAQRGVSYALNLLHRQAEERKTASPTATAKFRLFHVAQSAGVSQEDLARRARLDHSVLSKFDQRRIREPIPRLCGEWLSASVNLPLGVVRALLTAEPVLAPASRHKSKSKPKATMETFEHAIRSSSLPAEDRQFWFEVISRDPPL
jgi:hypothetical protein